MLTIKYLISLDDVNFVTPVGAVDIATAHAKATGSSGLNIYSFSPEPAAFIKISIENTVATAASVSGLLFIN